MASETISAQARPLVSDFLLKASPEGNQYLFEVPEYQRPYVWTQKQCDALFSDIANNDAGYFMGAIICTTKDSSSGDYSIYEVVDGQQRLTTLSIFLATIYESLSIRMTKLSKKYPDEFNSFWKDNRYGWIFDGIQISLTVRSKGKVRTRILPQNEDNRDDYFRILFKTGILTNSNQLVNTPYNDKVPDVDGRRLLTKAYRYFEKAVESYAGKGDWKEQIENIIQLHKLVTTAQFVMITADSHLSANILFEALNNRGTPLTITDLIKNRLFAVLKNTDSDTYSTRLQQWDKLIRDKVFKANGREISGGEQERFFRQSYNAFRTTWNKEYPAVDNKKPKFSLGKRATLYGSYVKMIESSESSPSKVWEQIRKSANIYPQIQGLEESGSTKLDKAYKDLARINGATSYTLLLYLVENNDKLQLKAIDHEKICQVLITFYVRQNFTNEPLSNSLEKIFTDFIDEIEQNRYVGDSIRTSLALKFKKNYGTDASNEKFKAALRDNVYDKESTNNAIRFVLVKLAESYLGEQAPDFWEKKQTDKDKKEFLKWTIEHILPQNIDSEWKAHLASDESTAEQIQAETVNKLGNLTLTTSNGTLSNHLFLYKKTTPIHGFDDSILEKGLNSYVCQQTEWGAKQIKKRTELLIEKILEIFKW